MPTTLTTVKGGPDISGKRDFSHVRVTMNISGALSTIRIEDPFESVKRLRICTDQDRLCGSDEFLDLIGNRYNVVTRPKKAGRTRKKK